jgi:hypothetical protein
MTAPALIRQNAAYLQEDFPDARLCFFGHSHEQKVYEVDGEQVNELTQLNDQHEGPMLLNRLTTHFVNPGSIDASRKREHKLAECAIFDSGAWSIEFLRVPYDCAATEAKAAVFGYRIGPWTDRLYSLRRRLAERL